ncbi:unnamed protein product [Phytophthora fragariaefolia]|uniref:Unnamed protein product n=1 Tax=Phytophthora fragariaefolia TaxID=1490495 RepID=A0A9W6XJP1_9STRA|nr:unnamed protein product [Phytophthora fragariaefolia]
MTNERVAGCGVNSFELQGPALASAYWDSKWEVVKGGVPSQLRTQKKDPSTGLATLCGILWSCLAWLVPTTALVSRYLNGLEGSMARTPLLIMGN